jgi:AraC family transcriptional regulator
MSVGGRFQQRDALQLLHTHAGADVRLVSPESGWDVVAASRFRFGKTDIPLPPLCVPVFGVSYGALFHAECMLQGQPRSGRYAPGSIAIVPPDFAARWLCDKAADVVVVHLSRDVLDHSIVEGAGRNPGSVEIIPKFVIRDVVLERIAHQLLHEITWPQDATRLRVEAWALELAARLLDAHSNLGRPLDSRRRIIPIHKLRRVEEFIDANLARNPSLAEVATAADMTLFHFAKAFRQTTGRAPHRYITEQRLLKARTLLHNAALPIGAIADAVGLTHSHFTRLFTRHMAMTPKSFRELLEC